MSGNGGTRGSRLGRAALVAGLLGLAACAPALAPSGPPNGRAAMTTLSFRARDGIVLPLRSWEPAQGPVRAEILALHGFNDYSGAFETAGPALAARGIAVHAYDQRGFGTAPGRGLWPGGDILVRDAREAIATLHARHPERPLYVLGESMGGAIAITALTGPGAPRDLVAGLVLSAPAVWGRDTMPWSYRAALWLASRVVPGLRLSGKGLKRYPSDNLPLLYRIAEDPLWIRATRTDAMRGVVDIMDQAYARAGALGGPVLMLYGLNDQIIPAKPIREVARRLPGEPPLQRLAVYPEGWHLLTRDLQAEVVLDDIAAWIANPAAPLPSRAEERAGAFLKGELTSMEERDQRADPYRLWQARKPAPPPQ
ncbi:alpha/beta hydrolase, partial [Rhodospirillum rubrum]|uniref:alpha/beta fold hydrolase n=2 Tax=Rhodospirillum rubrum TaxID=1085 RepID=UPI0019044BE7|nr:alpha/beta hydrolase [Rhodospirillum rubrum]